MTSPAKNASDIEIEYSEQRAVEEIKEPVDKGHVTYMIFLLFGVGALLPWNAILCALDFFSTKVILITCVLSVSVVGRIPS